MYTMKQACQAAGMSYETLKFYCNEGLVPNVKRSANNYRIFDDHDINWIKSLSCFDGSFFDQKKTRRSLSIV